MPRAGDVIPVRLRRQVMLRSGAAADRMSELLFRVRHRPRGLLHASADVPLRQLHIAIAAGVRFLRQRQHGDGSWRGFLLYPGASTTWLTAHLAFVLEELPELEATCAHAAVFLQSSGAHDGGWGYNRRVAVDCDSWSQALMVLARHALTCEAFLVSNLAAAQLDCGGFPTYPPPPGGTGAPANGWQAAHPEVSAMVAEALRRQGGFEARVDRCLRWLRDTLRGGVLPSYWWNDDCYALWIQARTGLLAPAASESVLDALRGGPGVPQLAMALTAGAVLGLADEILAEATRRVLLEQLSDGSWLCAPCLRVTDPRQSRAGPGASGPVVSDRRRLFSTAHAVAALFRVKTRYFPGEG